MKNWRIGIDVGGTNTDAVVIDEKLNLVAGVKNPTTDDVMTGIEQAMHRVLAMPGVDKEKIGYAMLGTTHCTNPSSLMRTALLKRTPGSSGL